jgi:DNA-binding response OmpR family regulator
VEARVSLARQPLAGRSVEQPLVSLGNLEIDGAVFRVRIAKRPVELSFFEYELMRVLSDQPDRILSYDTLTNQLWGATGRSQTRRLQVLVHRLRAKLVGSQPYNLETVRGRGYGLVTQLRPTA